MKFEYIPENEAEKKLIEIVLHAPDNASEIHTFEERLSFIEHHVAKMTISMMEIDRKVDESMEDESVTPDEIQKVIDELKSVRAEMDLFRQMMLDVEELKVLQRRVEADQKKAEGKVDGLQRMLTVSNEVLNAHADDLDRLTKEVFGDEL